jgi:hypothetical protein
MPSPNLQHQAGQPDMSPQVRTYAPRLSGTEQRLEAAFTPKRSLVRSQYRRPRQSPDHQSYWPVPDGSASAAGLRPGHLRLPGRLSPAARGLP